MFSKVFCGSLTFEPWRSLAILIGGAAAMPLVLAGLLGVSKPASAADGQFVNISTRALVETGEEVMIGGFIIEDGSRQVLIQALGPELADRGITNALADPVLTVIQISEGEPPRTPLDPPIEFMVNDNWEDSQGQRISAIWGGDPPLAAGSLSSAAVLTLVPGGYTAKVEGKNGTAGVAIVEVYGIDSAGADGNLVNISTRALVETGEEVMIGGFIIEDGSRQVLIQARGPELENDDISNVLADPVLTVIQTSEGDPPRTPLDPPLELKVNDNWEEDDQGQLITDLWGGSPNLTARSLSSAAVLTLGPGGYTAKVEGKDETTGVAIIEVYGIDDSDREALATLYNAMDGANWTRSDHWATDVPLDQWYGVTVDEIGQVIELDLSENELSGPIPVELGHLGHLERLWLYDNQLTGPIPAELGRLTNLIFLSLRENQLSGPIPVELGNLANLKGLWLYDNQLSGPIPAELGNLANLQNLSLRENQLNGPIPVELANLANLEGLWLYDNQLTGPIPAELGRLTNLIFLSLRENQLSGPIPAELGSLANLLFLGLQQNQLSGLIPVELGNLANLEVLGLYDNQLSGPIPVELGSLANLLFLGLYENHLTGPIPAELGSLANLEFLGIYENQLSGPIPAELGNLANLQSLGLNGNNLSGCIPSDLRDIAENDFSQLGLSFCGDFSGPDLVVRFPAVTDDSPSRGSPSR